MNNFIIYETTYQYLGLYFINITTAQLKNKIRLPTVNGTNL